MPVHFETTSATSSSVTLLRSSLLPALLFGLQRLLESALELGDLAVLELGHTPEIGRAPCLLELGARALDLFFDLRLALHQRLLGLPDLLEVRVLLVELRDLRFEVGKAALRRVVRLLLQCLALDLELDQPPLEPVHLLGLRVDFHADARRRLVDQVDGLVGQLPVADVTVRERRGRDDGRVRDLDLVMHLVAFFQAAQDRDRVLDGRLVDEHLLEPALERGVLLDVFAVLVERRRADAMQLAARERGLQHVAGVHRAFGLAGADHRVQLVDEENDLAFLFREIVQHGLEPLLELAAEFRARDQRAHVERQHALALQPVRHLAVDDALREALDDGRLADAGLADQNGVVLRAPLEHLDRAADLVVAADDGIELLLLRARREVDRVLLERLAVLLGVLVVDLAAAANLVDGPRDRALDGARPAREFGRDRSSTARPRAGTARPRCTRRRALARACP